jgi:suppressor of tumorigenicity protein 13
MSSPLSNEAITQLKFFIELCKSQPSVLNNPQLSFFKDFIEKLGGKVPQPEKEDEDTKESFDKDTKSEPQEPESEESDVELDMTGVIEPDNDPPQPMGDYDLQPTEEQIEQSQNKRSEAVSAFVEKDYENAVKLYTDAILLNPQASLLYAKRGQVYLLLNKPNACIRDCNRALELNPDSAAAHKFRGRANQLLGKWEEAANDLRKACKFDFDEQADEWLREVTPNARKIEEHKRKKERRALERQERERQERLRKVREAQAKAREESAKQQQHAEPNDMPGGMPGGAAGMGQFAQFLNDPEVLTAFQDPEVTEAFKDISTNPSNLFKYQSNPKVMGLINKVASKFGGTGGLSGMMGGLGGMMGGMPGGMGGMPGFGGAGANPPPPEPRQTGPTDDIGLD